MTERYQKLSEKLRTDLTGRKFGRWLVLSYAESRRSPNGVTAAYWLCQCECGVKKPVIAESLVSGHSKSCGCLCGEEAEKRMKTHGRSKTTEAILWYKARKRAKKSGLEFDLDLDDIYIPERCPLLGIALAVAHGRPSPGSPSLDRYDSTKGYVRGNVWVISHRANTLKGDATVGELRILAENMQKFHGAAAAAGVK